MEAGPITTVFLEEEGVMCLGLARTLIGYAEIPSLSCPPADLAGSGGSW